MFFRALLFSHFTTFEVHNNWFRGEISLNGRTTEVTINTAHVHSSASIEGIRLRSLCHRQHVACLALPTFLTHHLPFQIG